MTDFDVTTYPLNTDTDFEHDLGTETDRLKSGALKLRVLTTVEGVDINCQFMPMSTTSAQSFMAYLRMNKAVELDITHNGDIYRGYVQGNSPRKKISSGAIQMISFVFNGVLV